MPLEDSIKNLYGKKSIDSSGNVYGISTSGTGIFGTFTKEDEARYSREMAQAQTLADIEIMKYQNEYNSPVAQAQRMREAGINPDLNGIDNMGSADASAASGASPAGSNPTETMSNVVTSAFDAFGLALNVCQGLMNFQSAQESIQSQKIDNVLKMDSFAMDYLLGTLTPDSFNEDGSLGDDRRTSIISSASGFAKKIYGWNNRQSKRFTDSVVRAMNNPRFVENFYRSMNSGESSRQSYLAQTTGDMYSMQDRTMRILLDELIREKNKAMKSGYRRQSFMNYYDADFYGALDPGSFAERQNIQNVSESAEMRSELYSKSFYYNLNKKLNSDYRNGNILSGILSSLLGFGRRNASSMAGLVGSLL